MKNPEIIDRSDFFPPMVDKGILGEILEKNEDILELFRPVIDTYPKSGQQPPNIYGIANETGVILDIVGNARALYPLSYERGRIHSEVNVGPNAIGTSIKTGKPVALRGNQHTRQELWDWAGFGSPIYGGSEGIKGVFFIISPLMNARKDYISLVQIIANSIEKQLRLQDENKKLAIIQRAMEKDKDKIKESASIVSHEIRNSLANISAYIQLLELDQVIEDFRGKNILKEITRINSLLDDFRFLSRDNRSGVFPQSLVKVICHVLNSVEFKARLNNVDIIFEGYEKDAMVNIDENALHHVFINLIDNAIQVMKDGGLLYIELDIDKDKQEMLVTFQDTGPGISVEEVHRIFEIFHTTKESGSGLGLHISRTLLEMYGGSISASSSPGKGATFIVKLPIVYNTFVDHD